MARKKVHAKTFYLKKYEESLIKVSERSEKNLALVAKGVNSRVDSFVFFLFCEIQNYKIQIRNNSLFRRVSIVSRNWKKYENTKKVFQVVSRNWKKRFISYFRIFPFNLCTFSSNFEPFHRVSYLLLELCIFLRFSNILKLSAVK